MGPPDFLLASYIPKQELGVWGKHPSNIKKYKPENDVSMETLSSRDKEPERDHLEKYKTFTY